MRSPSNGPPNRCASFPFAPGGTTDAQARMLAKRTETLGQGFVVENRIGASGMIGTDAVARGPADGYTLLFTSSALSVNTTLFAGKFKFDPVKDLAPVIWTSSVPLVLTLHPSVPAKNVKELIELSKRVKGGLNGGHNGSGTTSHIAIEMLSQFAGAQLNKFHTRGVTHHDRASRGRDRPLFFDVEHGQAAHRQRASERARRHHT